MSETNVDQPMRDLERRATPARPLMDRNPRIAAWVFGLYLVVGFLVIMFVVGDHRWFLGDEWTFLAGRETGSLSDYFKPINGHWVTLPLLVWRGLFEIFGLHSYLPYQATVVVTHLTTALLLRVVMRRGGVAPWMATLVASLFVLLGSGELNIVWAFQLTLVGSLALGLGHVILVDHRGALDRRDHIGLALGAAALMCSGVGVPMAVAAGVAAWMRRGWRIAAFHTVPLGILFGAWFVIVRPPSVDSGVDLTASETVTKGAAFFWSGVSGIYVSIGQSTVFGLALAALLISGLVLAWRPLDRIEFREKAALPIALLVGAVVFLVMTTSTAIDRGMLPGLDDARADRYVHVLVALVLPAVAVAADALVRRWTWTLPLVVVVLLAGVPGNVDQFEKSFLGSAYFQSQQRLIFGIGRTEEAGLVPEWVNPEPIFTPDLSVGWLHEIDRDGKLPDAFAPDGTTEQMWPIRLGLSSATEEVPESLECETRARPLDLETEKGQQIAILDDTVDVLALEDGKKVSGPVRFAGRPPQLLTVHLDDLELRFQGTVQDPTVTICR